MDAQTIFIAGMGGFMGAILRYALSTWMPKSKTGFPTNTFLINILGAFILSFILYSAEYSDKITENFRIFSTIGVMGAFTTMSTFSFEAFGLIDEGKLAIAIFYIFLTIIITILGIYMGKMMATQIYPQKFLPN